jgi:malonyl-CoA O-methyltransferase
MNATSHQIQVGRRFSAAAPSYDQASRVQEAVARRVIELTPAQANAHRVLDVGCGTGRLIARARARWPQASLLGLDLAEGMIRRARERFADAPNVAWAVGDATRFSQGAPYDLVLSSSSLQWLNPLATGLAHVFSLVKPGGYLVAGLMTRDTLRELHAARAAAAPHKMPPGHLPTLDLIEEAIKTLPDGRIQHLSEQHSTNTYPNTQALLRILHAMGVTGGDLSRGSTPLNRTELQALMTYYDQHFAHESNGVTATFSVCYLVMEHT